MVDFEIIKMIFDVRDSNVESLDRADCKNKYG